MMGETAAVVSEAISSFGFIGGTTLLAVVAYFLKKLVTKVDTNGESVQEFRQQVLKDIGSLKDGVNQSLLINKKEVISMFHEVCHERQGTCSGLVEARIENLKSHYLKICHRIDEMTNERKDAWKEQRNINSNLYDTLYKRLVDKEGARWAKESNGA
jgi:ABC-type Na+ transport system ATPase subunit NatA